MVRLAVVPPSPLRLLSSHSMHANAVFGRRNFSTRGLLASYLASYWSARDRGTHLRSSFVSLACLRGSIPGAAWSALLRRHGRFCCRSSHRPNFSSSPAIYQDIYIEYPDKLRGHLLHTSPAPCPVGEEGPLTGPIQA